MNLAPPTDEENRTLIRKPVKTGVDGHTLPVGTRLGEFEIVGLIGEGGFGIVYRVLDHSLQRNVALKEYMPSSLAVRDGGALTVAVKSPQHTETFQAGLRSFVNEARLLAQFDHPALVKVHRFWEANGTAYMVMPFYEGPTLKSALAGLDSPPDEIWFKHFLDPLLDALATLHGAHCFHRDISPDNILLTPKGPLLLDFGAARRVIGEANQALTVILKSGYAPVEQYGEIASMAQGPWTDIYALACVVYAAISGKTPMSSVERLLDDRLEPISRLAAGRYDKRFLNAIDAGLSVKPQDRPQDVARFRKLLDISDATSMTADSVATLTVQRPPSIFANAINTLTRTKVPKGNTRAHSALRPPTVLRVQSALPPSPHRTRQPRIWYTAGAAALVIATTAVLWMWRSPASRQSAAQRGAALPTEVIAAPDQRSQAVAPKQQAAIESSQPVSAPGSVEASMTAAEKSTAPGSTAPGSGQKQSPQGDSYIAPPTPGARPSLVAGAEPITRPTGARPAASSDLARRAGRCSDLLQKASLESLEPEEKEFLQRECK
jgi:serine/threonine protein kinase